MKPNNRQADTQTKRSPGHADRRLVGIITLVLGFAMGGPVVIQAQQQSKMFKIGYLDIGGSIPRYQSLRRILPDLGYVEGKNITFEYRTADNKLDLLPALAEELIRLDVDVLVTRGTPEALALKKITRTIPIVFYDVTDPIAAGLIDSLARPGGNITGFTGLEAVLAGKRLELLKETVTKLSRVAVLWNPQDLSSAQQWKAFQPSARDLGLQLHSMEVSSPDKYRECVQRSN